MRKKLFTSLIALAAMLTFSPHVWADAPTKEQIDQYKEMPLTFETRVTGNALGFNVFNDASSKFTANELKSINLEYRFSNNDGVKWSSWTSLITSSGVISNPSSVNLQGDATPYTKICRIQVRGVNPNGLNKSATKFLRFVTTCTNTVYYYGNIMSLIVGYDTSNETQAKQTLAKADEIPNAYCFYGLFSTPSSGSGNYKRTSPTYAESMILPATKLTNECYGHLFYNAATSDSNVKKVYTGPTILATSFSDKNGDVVSGAFEGLMYYVTNMTSIAVNIKDCPEEGDDNLTNWMYNISAKTLYAPDALENCDNLNLLGNWTKSEFSYVTSVQYNIKFTDEDDNVKCEFDIDENKTPVYTGEDLSKSGYKLEWYPAIEPATKDQTYKATYKKLYKLTTNTSGQGTVTLTAEGYDDNAGEYLLNTTVTMTVTPNDGKRFVQWSDGNTDKPRTITITSDTTFTAEFGIESADASVTPSQDATHDVTQIVYYLKPATYDNITYTPVDMGYGVAWADRNMGAATTDAIGGYYYWGGTNAATKFQRNVDYGYIDVYDKPTGFKLPDSADVANVNLGSRWHIPSNTEWQELIAQTDMNNYTYTSRSNSNNFIFLPATGEYDTPSNNNSTSTVTDEQSRYYWSNTLHAYIFPWVVSEPYYFYQNSVIYGTNTNGKSGVCTNGMPVRAIYKPLYTPRQLTIHVGDYDYVYLCQEGQNVTVTPTPATGYMFDKWQDNKSTTAARTFTIGSKDVEYTALFKEIPQEYTITIESNNSEYGSVSESELTVEQGTTISVKGTELTIGENNTVTATPTKANALYAYAFTGWTSGGNTISDGAIVGGDMTITANFTATPKAYFELVDTARVGDNFYTILDTLVNKEKNVQYMRTFPEGTTDAPSWNVFSLPFGYNIEEDLNFQGRVVQLDHATYDEGTDVLTLYFVYQNTYLNANKPYVFYNKGAALVEPVFNNVTIEAQADGSYAKTCTPNGQVYFRNTQVRGSLAANSNIAFLYNNKLYYSGQGNSMRAFRGYFEMEGVRPSGSPAPRRIVMMVDEATGLTSEMEVTSISTKKVIEDGILYIERNGVRYDAQGAIIK